MADRYYIQGRVVSGGGSLANEDETGLISDRHWQQEQEQDQEQEESRQEEVMLPMRRPATPFTAPTPAPQPTPPMLDHPPMKDSSGGALLTHHHNKAMSNQQHHCNGGSTDQAMSVSNLAALAAQPNLTPTLSSDHEIGCGVETQDTVTVWVPGGEDPPTSRHGPCCCLCCLRMHCGLWVVLPLLVLIAGVALTGWVWMKYRHMDNVMNHKTSTSAVFLGPILILFGIVGAFVACVLHEIHVRQHYNPLDEEYPTEEFL